MTPLEGRLRGRGAALDLTFVATWIAAVGVGDCVIRRTRKPARARMPTALTT